MVGTLKADGIGKGGGQEGGHSKASAVFLSQGANLQEPGEGTREGRTELAAKASLPHPLQAFTPSRERNLAGEQVSHWLRPEWEDAAFACPGQARACRLLSSLPDEG